jgi:hypothetical protein
VILLFLAYLIFLKKILNFNENYICYLGNRMRLFNEKIY